MILGPPAAWARIATVTFGATVLGLAGCDAGDNQPPAPSDIQVQLGGTAADGSGFGALQGDVFLIPGAQGGFHVWMKYRVAGPRVGLVRVAYTARRVTDDRLILTSGRQQELGAAGDDGYWESPVAIPAFMCPSPLGVQVRDEQIRFRIEIQELDGPSLGSAEAQATPHCPEGDQSVFCIRICSG